MSIGGTADPLQQIARLAAHARAEPRPHHRAPDKLAGLRQLLAALGHPEREGRTVHVAGTVGKGAVCAMIARLLAASHDPVGLYTSPHLVDIRERIRIGGRLISTESFAGAIARVLDTAEAIPGLPRPAYFDLLTAIALVAFREAGAGWRVLETGLGGMADATNVTEKRLAVIATIGHDHQAVLGQELREIAGQKLGIVPPGGDVVLGPQPPGLRDWMAAALAAAGSRVLWAEEIGLHPAGPEAGDKPIRLSWPDGPATTLAAAAHHATLPRRVAVRTALRALDALEGPPANDTEAARRAAIAWETPLPGRQQWLDTVQLAGGGGTLAPLVLDGAHNAEALAALAAQLERWGLTGYTLLVTLLGDKMVPAVGPPLTRLLAGAGEVRGVLLPFERAAAPEALRDYLAAHAPHRLRDGIALGSPDDALQAAAAAGGPVVVAGSLWLVGEVLRRLHLPPAADPTAPG